jgi:DNA-binding response OmpR family regulator
MRKPRIIAVDDDTDILKVIKSALQNESEILLLSDSTEVIPNLEKFKPDLLIIDIMMPTLSGYEICEIIRNNTDYYDMPIAFMTSFTDEGSRREVFKIGGSYLIEKPFEIEKIKRVVHLLLELWEPKERA